MCGICGIINFCNQPVEETSIRRMMQIMKHRGPDDEGVFIENYTGLGFVRLSIIDLSTAGHQPMFSRDTRYIIVFNGEIYNFIELREELTKEGIHFQTQTDTEVLLNAWLQWGDECLDRFNGMWAFAIYDRDKKTTFAARDRFGIKPFYYLHSNEYFAFCSEIPPLLSILGKKPTPNNQTIFDFLIFNRTDQTENTFFTEVLKLQHGHKLTIIDNNVTITKWYDLKEKSLKVEGFENPDEYRELFTSAIRLHLRSDVPVGVCLSGGLDSSSLVSVISNSFIKNGLNTFSAVYEKGQTGDETEFINEYKPLLKNMFFNTPNSLKLLKDLKQFIIALGEPIPTTSPYAQYKVMKLAKGKVSVTLDGQGADEELAGYHDFFAYYFKDLLLNFKFYRLTREIIHYLDKHRNFYALKAFLFFLLPESTRTSFRIKEKKYLVNEFSNSYAKTNAISNNLYGAKSLKEALLNHFEYKLEHLLKWSDRNSMHFSIESRVPFLDYRLVEKTIATQSNLLINNGVTKYILREAMKGILPEKIRLRMDKIGFSTPEDDWFRTEDWREMIMGIITSDKFSARKIIDSTVALKLYNQHLSGKKNHSKEIWKWVNLELWFREFIDCE